MREIPEELRKQGIRSVSDNLDGRVVKLPHGLLVDYFGRDLLELLAKRRVRGGVCPSRDAKEAGA